MPQTLPPVWVLVGIGLVSGFFGALFGVGGGIVIVPLLVLLAGFESRAATGTSLAVIVLTGLFGVVAFLALGEVEGTAAALLGLPALAGTFVGTRLQRRVSSRLLVLLFAVFLVAVAARLAFA